MSSRTKLPKWFAVDPSVLDLIDLGIKYRPLENRDFTSGVFIRGPVIIAATRNTKDEVRKLLPIPAVDVAVEVTPTQSYLSFWTSSDRQRMLPISPSGISDGNSILVSPTGFGEVRIRKMLDGDLSLFSLAPSMDETTVKQFVKKFWEGM